MRLLTSNKAVSKLSLFEAYFDSRARNGHRNLTMIFITASKGVREKKSILGCGVGIFTAKEFHLRYIQEAITKHHDQQKYFKYEQMMLECFDVPVSPGDRAFVKYNTSQNTPVVLRTAQAVVFPEPRVTPKGPNNISVVVCTKAYSRGVTWLPEFLRYQKTLGVDHVHLAVLDEFREDGGYHDILSEDRFFVESKINNYTTVKEWKEWHEKKDEWDDHGTMFMYLDCVYRYRGTYDYIILLDTDDFFTVRFPGMSLKDMIVKYCSSKTTGTCVFDWLFYYPELCGLKHNVSEDGNVTAAMNPHKPDEELKYIKSIHRTEAIIDSTYHLATCPGCMIKGYKHVTIPSHIAYVAHQRKNASKEKEKKCSTH